jgi:hypothetical protein
MPYCLLRGYETPDLVGNNETFVVEVGRAEVGRAEVGRQHSMKTLEGGVQDMTHGDWVTGAAANFKKPLDYASTMTCHQEGDMADTLTA